MALFDTLDIPDALLDLWNAIFAVGNSGTTLGYRYSPSSRSPARRTALSVRSLLVILQPIWYDLTGAQYDAWEAYWSTLPFGPHSGLNGWPGSGFSAFVYENAKCYRAGLDWMLWPPTYNMVYNGDFALGSSGWTLVNATISAGQCNFADPLHNAQLHNNFAFTFDLRAGHTYRIQIEIGAGTGQLNWGLDMPFGPHPTVDWTDDAGAGALSHDVAIEDDFAGTGFYVQTNGIALTTCDNIAVYDLGPT